MRITHARTVLPLVLALLMLSSLQAFAEDEPQPAAKLPDLDTLTRVPVALPSASEEGASGAADQDEEAWRSRFQSLRTQIAHQERTLALKRAELYDKFENETTEKKPRRFSIEGFVINTEKTGDEPRFIDPLEREVYERDKALQVLRRELRELDFRASVAGVPKAWRR